MISGRIKGHKVARYRIQVFQRRDGLDGSEHERNAKGFPSLHGKGPRLRYQSAAREVFCVLAGSHDSGVNQGVFVPKINSQVFLRLRS